MAYSRITGTRHGADAIYYARGNGKGHNDKKVRNMVVSEVNMLPETVQPYEVQMKRYWNRASAKNKNQVRRIIQSFSRKEFNPDKLEDIQKANEIGIEFVQRAYPGHQAIVFTQIDGKSGLIHNHIILNNVNMETWKGCTDEQTRFSYVKEWTNKVAGQYIELDYGENDKDKTTQNERRKRQENEKIIEENKKLPPEKQKALKYIWKDDLKSRILEAMDVSKDYVGFFSELRRRGVEVEIRTRRTGRRAGESYIVYELEDTSLLEANLKKVPANLKAKGNKLGTLYDMSHLDEIFEKSWKEHKEESEKFANAVIKKQEKRYLERMQILDDYGPADYDDEKEAYKEALRRKQEIEEEWKRRQELKRKREERERLDLEQEKRESEERQTETVVGRMAVPVAEYEYVNGELRQISGEKPEQKSEEVVEEKQIEQTVKVKPVKEEKSVQPVTKKPVKLSEKVVEKKPQQSVQKKTAVAAQKRQEQVRRNNAVQSSKMAAKAKMEAKKQAHVAAFRSDERALPYIDWGDRSPDDFGLGR